MKLLYCLSSLTLRRFRSTIVVEFVNIFYSRYEKSFRRRFERQIDSISKNSHIFISPRESINFITDNSFYQKEKIRGLIVRLFQRD